MVGRALHVADGLLISKLRVLPYLRLWIVGTCAVVAAVREHAHYARILFPFLVLKGFDLDFATVTRPIVGRDGHADNCIGTSYARDVYRFLSVRLETVVYDELSWVNAVGQVGGGTVHGRSPEGDVTVDALSGGGGDTG